MQTFTVVKLILLLYFPFNNGEGLPKLSERDVDHTLFGDIGSMRDLFLNESQPTRRDTRDSGPADDNKDSDGLDLELPNVFDFPRTNHTFDITDFLTINEQYSNFIKEYKDDLMKNPIKNLMRNRTRDELKNKTRRSYDDPDDYYHGESIEWLKKNQLIMVLAQFALHCRYEVGKALLQRDLVRHDKRYKLGYLFNRMRRLKTEQLKQAGVAYRVNWNYANAEVSALMRNYERVVHYDVDMRDTANLIKTIFNRDEPYDYFVIKSKSSDHIKPENRFDFMKN